MYSREFFVTQFQKIESEELIEKLAVQELTDEAREALHLVLKNRGISSSELDGLVHQSRKDQYLKTSATNQCDFCGKSLLPGSFRVDGQKFCNVDCFHTSRLREAAVDITNEQALERAISLKAGPCPECSLSNQHPEINKSHTITSMVFVVTTSTQSKFHCKSCAHTANLWAIFHCLTLGWWSLKGIFATPFYVIKNISEMLGKHDASGPSPDLIDWAKLMVAEDHVKAAGGGKWGLGT